ncbi:MAG TPA: VTT domain-containing protein, partial [Myxococcota bacterium]|nr:VTT domain-containing protein [Myxococcota bacterium]
SECDLAIEARGDGAAARAIAGVREDLLAEHLGVSAERVAAEVRARGSLAAAVDALRGGPRTLEPIEVELDPLLDELVPDAAVIDPEKPVGPDELMTRLLPELGPPEGRTAGRLLALALAAVAVGALWRFTPLSEWATPDRLAALAEPLRADPLGAPLFAAVIVAASLLLVPITALAVGSSLVFGPLLGFAAAFAGALASAVLGFAIGRALWGDAVQRLAGRRLRRLRVQFARQGLLAVAALRLVPVAPFTVVNLAAGASPLSFREYLLGSALALGPSLLVLAFLADRARHAVLEPGYWTFAALTALLAAGWVAFAWARRRVARQGS